MGSVRTEGQFIREEILDKFGLDIQQKKGKCPGYYIGARDFELPELKLLVDAVQS